MSPRCLSLALLLSFSACGGATDVSWDPSASHGDDAADGLLPWVDVAPELMKPRSSLKVSASVSPERGRGYRFSAKEGDTFQARLSSQDGDPALVLYGPQSPGGTWEQVLTRNNDASDGEDAAEIDHEFIRAGNYMLVVVGENGEGMSFDLQKSLNRAQWPSEDIEAAYEILDAVTTLGDCSWSITAPHLQGSRLSLDLKFEHEADGVYVLENKFYNDTGSISRVDVKYAGLGLGEPYKVILEKIDATAGSAYKYLFTFDVEEGKPVSARLKVMLGTSWNVRTDITCK